MISSLWVEMGGLVGLVVVFRMWRRDGSARGWSGRAMVGFGR